MKTISLHQLTEKVEPLIKIEWVTPSVINISGASMPNPKGSITKITTVKAHGFVAGQSVYIYGVEDDLLKGFYEIQAVEKSTTFTIEAQIDESFRSGKISLPKTYKVYEKEDLPVSYFARYNKAQADMMEALDLVSPQRAKATLAKAVAGNIDGDEASDEVVKGLLERVDDTEGIGWGDLAQYATKQLQQSCAMLEALAQMPDGLLISTEIPSSVVAEVYSMVQTALEERESESSDEDIDSVEESGGNVKRTPRRRKAKEQTESIKNTSED